MKAEKIILPFEKYHIPRLHKLTDTKRYTIEEYNNLVYSNKWKLHSYKCLCGSENFSVISTIDKEQAIHPVVMCNNCGLVQANPRFSPGTYKQFFTSDIYRKLYCSETKITSKFTIASGIHIYKAIKKVKKLSPETKLLEVGAGAGWNLLPFIENSVDVLGVDINPDLVEEGKKFGINMVQGDEFSVEGPFDIIILKGILQRTTQPVIFLKTLCDKLKDDGIIYIEVNDFGKPNPAKYEIRQIFHFNKLSLKHFVSLANLVPITVENTDDGNIYGIFRKGSYKNDKLLNENLKKNKKYFSLLKLKDSITLSKKIKSFDNVPAKIFFD